MLENGTMTNEMAKALPHTMTKYCTTEIGITTGELTLVMKLLEKGTMEHLTATLDIAAVSLVIFVVYVDEDVILWITNSTRNRKKNLPEDFDKDLH
jgi:hypothetical protein